jgi:hypothetical protein
VGLKLAAEQWMQLRLQANVVWISICRKGGTRLKSITFRFNVISFIVKRGFRLLRMKKIFLSFLSGI